MFDTKYDYKIRAVAAEKQARQQAEQMERLKDLCEKQDDYIHRICTVGFDECGADMYKEIIDLREKLVAPPQKKPNTGQPTSE